jgi:protein TonB
VQDRRAGEARAPSRAGAGEVQAYARSVAQALGRTEPKAAAAASGTVLVVFTIAADGNLEAVGVQQSSGNARLDERAMDAVRRARFAAPPAGLVLAERSFRIRYQFR